MEEAIANADGLDKLSLITQQLVDFGIRAGERILIATLVFIVGRFLISMLNRFVGRLMDRRKVDISIKTPTELFESLGHFDFGGGGFHCVHMTEHDLEIFRNRGLWAVTNPGSNAKLASGIAPLRQMRELGIRMAIGTDGPSSNNALDFFREMYLAAVLQKLHCGDAAALPADDVLHMATVGGAQAMGLSDCDVLAPGKQADLIVIDLQRPNMQPVHNAARNLVYSGSKENVRLTMIAGRVLYENGAFFIGEPVQDIYRAVESNFAAMRAAL